MIKLSYFIFGYFFYLFFGAWIFYELNYLEEKKQHINVNNQIRQFIQRNRKCLKGRFEISKKKKVNNLVSNSFRTRFIFLCRLFS